MGLKLIGEVALDGSGFERGLHEMASSVKGFIAGAFGLYGVEAMIHKTVDTAKELVTESKRLGVGVEQLQVLKQAAKDNSTELDVLAKSFEKLDVAREKALSGSKEGKELLGRFKQLGISQEDLKSKSAADLFMGPIRGKANSMSQEDLGPILKEVLGKGFGEVIPVLKTDFGELEEKMRKLGTIMSTETAVSLHVLETEASLLAQIMAGHLAPMLLTLAEGIYNVVGALASWWAWLKGLISGGSEKSTAIMAATPGYGGYAPGQKEEMDKALAMKGQTKDEALKNAEDAFAAEAAKWNATLDDFKKRVAEEAEKLKNPTKPKFEVPPAEAAAKQTKEFHQKGDALLNVGNFLGSSRGVMEDIATRQLNVLQQIADNTKPSLTESGATDSDFPNT